MPRSDLWVVAYDITDQRRRRRVHRLLQGYGIAQQRSVFLCRLDPPRRRRLLEALAAEVHPASDRVDLFAAHRALAPASADPADLQALAQPWIVA